ncbi:hypothetical protein [Roseateles amylovorans]|uniref:Uncharacterized protein n=1 Tax=Roseateles amylovorans TaxID=2978473 RepID=A0ABY6B406_9BURK|nr:hypothetical protein [Roseateles amylovorans]UXH80103.1 hypothetical protein N4261_09560 [Roseateles amylovorans]
MELYTTWLNFDVPPATVMFYPSMAAAPASSLFVLVVADAGGRAGMHVPPAKPGDPPNRPIGSYAVVQFRPNDSLWAYAVSHEVLEMLVDPGGNRVANGMAPGTGAIPAQYLMEVCDPCQDLTHAYKLSPFDDVFLCDFCLPAFYGLNSGTKFTRTGSITQPLRIANGGSLVFRTEQHGWLKWTSGGVVPVDPATATITAADNIRGTLDRVDGYAGPHQELSSRAVRNKGLGKGLRTTGKGAEDSRARVAAHAKRLGIKT